MIPEEEKGLEKGEQLQQTIAVALPFPSPFPPLPLPIIVALAVKSCRHAPLALYIGHLRTFTTTMQKRKAHLKVLHRSSRQRPYHVEHTASRPISEVKQRWVWLVLGWVTAWEYQMLLAFCTWAPPLWQFKDTRLHSLSWMPSIYDLKSMLFSLGCGRRRSHGAAACRRMTCTLHKGHAGVLSMRVKLPHLILGQWKKLLRDFGFLGLKRTRDKKFFNVRIISLFLV